MNTATALAFILLTVAFTFFICIMFFALLASIKQLLEGINKIAEMNVLILKNGFELQLTDEEVETDNTGRVTGNSSLGADGVLRINLPENYFNAEFKENGENN